MAMSSRAARDTSAKWQGRSTPAAVGPGSYAPKGLSLSKQHPNFAGFSSSDARKLTHTAALSPGPGSYGPSKPTNEREADKGYSSFRSVKDRMGPSAPGSTVFLQNSAANNPGPGAYNFAVKKQQKRATTRDAPRFLTVFDVDGVGNSAPKPQFNPPTIPRREQAHGYYEGEDGRPKPLWPSNENAFSGLKNDTVGPCHYNVAGALDAGTGLFSKSGTSRALFRDQQLRPGPGDYDLERADAVVRMTRAQEGGSAFRSRVPMAFEMSSAHPATRDIGPGIIGPAKTGAPDWPSVIECFGATSKRTGWNRPMENPYADPTSTKTPGPGSYQPPSSSFRIAVQKRLTTEDIPIAFNSTKDRDLSAHSAVLEPQQQAMTLNNTMRGSRTAPGRVYAPGPGEYELAHHGVVESIIQRKAVGRHGIFGSCAVRFTKAGLAPDLMASLDRQNAPKEATQPPPPQPKGLGRRVQVPAWKLGDHQSHEGSLLYPTVDYNEGVVYHHRRKEPFHRSAKVERFSEKYDSRAPEFLQIGEFSKAEPGQYRIPSDFDQPPKRKVAAPTSSMASHAERFRVSELADEAPGPGSYQPKPAYAWKKSQKGAVLKSGDARFKTSVRTADDVGPGTYMVTPSNIKKSFNITYPDGYRQP